MSKGILNTLNSRQANIIRVMQKDGLNMALETLAYKTNTRTTSNEFVGDIAFLTTHGILRAPKAGYVEITDWAQENLQ